MPILHGRYVYTPRNVECTVTEIFPDRHRCNIVTDQGQTFQEVGFHDLQDLPVEPSSPPLPLTDEPEPSTPVVQEMDEERETSERPRRFWEPS